MLKQVLVCTALAASAMVNPANAQQSPPASDRAMQVEMLVNKAAALIDSKGKARGTEQIGVPLFDASANSDGKGIDAQSLWNLMQTLNSSGIAGKTVLRGRLDVITGPQAHQLADKSKALSDCRVCHRSGSQAFQSVTISLVGPDGRRVGYGANANVLNSAFSVDSVSGFYAIGGTRIKLLDILLALAIFGASAAGAQEVRP